MSKSHGKVTAVVDAQTGSTGKGVVSYHLRDQFTAAVRTGAPNAGHSFVHKGVLHKMQTIPCTWPNKKCALILGAGGLINFKLLKKEIDAITCVDPDITTRLVVDRNSGILEERHHEEEGGVDGEIHKRFGSTGEGVGAARRDRMLRDPAKFRLAQHCVDEFEALGIKVIDTVEYLHNHLTEGGHVLLEGTQGAGLSLIHGEWPYVTTNDTNASQLASDAGIPPHWVTDVIMVARTYPIRVAGPSGPMLNEVTWDEMSARIGRRVEERTTVTNKVRRIGEWNEAQFRKALMLNDPSWIALTFMDYLDPKCRNTTKFDKLDGFAMDFVHYLERTFSTKVGLIGTGFSESEGWKCIDRLEE